MLADDEFRCIGAGAGASGHQLRMDCLHCQRRTAPWAGYQVETTPPKEFPCPLRIPAEQAEAGGK